ncbi:MAG: ribonuclease HI [Proteobacteria bacterium]|nr:ribonuclease HI [Pseudomonadota bacterium]
MANKGTVIIYTDGGCSPNPGPGGWAALLQFGDHKKLISGSYKNTTNNRMEITAIIKAFECLNHNKCRLRIYTDSRYVSDAINKGWLQKWQQVGWRKSGREPVKNKALWQQILAHINDHQVEFYWVKAHAGISGNETVDMAATQARETKRGWETDAPYQQELDQENLHDS